MQLNFGTGFVEWGHKKELRIGSTLCQ